VAGIAAASLDCEETLLRGTAKQLVRSVLCLEARRCDQRIARESAMQARVLWVLKPLVLLLLTAAGSAPTLSAGYPHSPEERIDQIFKEWNTRHSPGASVAVIKNGRLLFEKGYGMANLEYGIPIKPDTIFHVASVSKQFTAMAVLLLEADGKLSIDDDVHKYLPELPDYGSRITLRNLLQHTSGIRDQWQLLGMAGWNLQDVAWDWSSVGIAGCA
jgi:CubicO group peptidase (beta-lactamase class C family)